MPGSYQKALADRFATIFIRNVPPFTGDAVRSSHKENPLQAENNEARRFVTLVDVLYERKCGVVVLSESGVDKVADALNDPDERPREAVSVVAEGGSSGRLTTMIGGTTEWSATGRIGASLAEFSASKDLRFSWKRTVSRLSELTSRP